MRTLLIPLLLFSVTSCSQSSADTSFRTVTKPVGGPCEGCEAIYESPLPFEALDEVDTLSIFNEQGPKLVVSGIVYKNDGKTPAPDVVLYVYQTDQTGQYRKNGNESGWGRRHGSIRGWMKTDANGQYRFYTIRPAAYSKTGPPAHIHITVKEPDKNEYYLDDFEFDDDPHLTWLYRKALRKRGGSGILKPEEKEGAFYGKRDIILGMNVTGYPRQNASIRK